MRTKTPGYRAVRSKTIPLTGGLNEETSNLEMQPGELFECVNYEEIDGSYHGYRSISGFERWDGTIAEAEYPFGSGLYTNAQYPSDVPITKDSEGAVIVTPTVVESYNVTTEDGVQIVLEDDSASVVSEDYTIDHTEREDRRAQITAIPGYGPVLYCGYYSGKVYAIREAEALGAGTGFVKLYLMAEGTDPVADAGGWTEVTEWPSDIPVNDPLVNPYRTTNCQFSMWPGTDPNTESIAFAQGLSPAIMVHRNELGVHTVSKVEDTNLPTENNPTIPLYFEDRLYLAYGNGYLFFSEQGQITFDPVFFAGEIYFGWPITDMVSTPGSAVVVWTEKGIKILKKITDDGSVLSPVLVETFSDQSSSLPMTANRLLGTMIFADDRGVTLLATSDAFGDFKAATLSKRVNRTYVANKDNVLSAIVNRSANQYVIIFKSGDGLVFTFDAEKQLKGTTYINTSHPMTYLSYGKDEAGDDHMISGDNEGYVMFWRSEAQSFDGENINTRMSTAYHHYGSVIHYKQFRKVSLEITSQRGTPFSIRCDYDYKSPLAPKGEAQYPVTAGAATGGIWGKDFWGSFQWSGAVVEVAQLYLAGWGVNMSVVLATSSNSYDPHTVHNFTTNYSLGSIRQ